MAKTDKNNVILSDQSLALLDELNVGAFTVDVNRKVKSMNLSAQALMGLKEKDVLGKDCRDIFTGVPCMVTCLLRSGNNFVTNEPDVEIVNENETKKLLTRMAIPVYDSGHRLAGCLTILQDHSPIADLIDRIHYEERSYKTILNNLDIGIFTVNRGGYITFFNSEAEKISGYDRRLVLGKPCAQFFGDQAADDMCLFREPMEKDWMNKSRQGEITTQTGETLPIRANYIPLKNEKEIVIGGLATFHDLTLVRQLDQAMRDRYTFHDMIGKSPEMQKVFEKVQIVAAADATILVEGPTGTGKDLLAKVIHHSSARSASPFVKVNCAAIPRDLLESEMFGYTKGAFTGADRDKPGRFNEADGGTIFLDEIGDLPLPLQAKLLRVLEDREFYPLGSRHMQKVDVRIISATNQGLGELVEKGLFREDLYYRLNVFRFDLPALKNRRVDISLLINHILRRLCSARDIHPVNISRPTMEILLNFDYPGNIRELENILEHALIISQESEIMPQHLPDYMQRPVQASKKAEPPQPDYADGLHRRERSRIEQALSRNNSNRTRTAQELGIDRTTLWRKMKRYGLLT
ncbi:MAG: sigma 54-interacting transcriptional regulator [Thermodesulfobacteriota bacterium]